MKRLLIVSKNVYFIKDIVNLINNNSFNSVKICTNINEIYNNIKMYNPNFILLDLNIKESQLFNLISMCNEHKIKLILISDIYTNFPIKDNIFIILRKEYNKKYIINYLNDTKVNTNLNIKNRILYIMKEIGFELKNKGDIFLLEAIKYIKVNKKITFNLENEIYPIIALKFKTTKNAIKWNIIYSINSTFLYNSKKMNNYLNINCKPTPKSLILKIIKNM